MLGETGPKTLKFVYGAVVVKALCRLWSDIALKPYAKKEMSTNIKKKKFSFARFGLWTQGIFKPCEACYIYIKERSQQIRFRYQKHIMIPTT